MERDKTTLDTINRLDAVWAVLYRLEEAGYEAYLVGGCVRDMLLGKSPDDYDVATNAWPEQVQSIFPKTVPTGIRHGTVSVMQYGERIEVTTFRQEQAYQDGRRPEQVEFITSLEKDLSRRDLTINAMAMDRKGKLYDPFNGKIDLLERRICAVGQAEERFREDALRMLRAIRFATTLDAQIESATWQGICQKADRMSLISRERIRDEWNKILVSNATTGLQLLVRSNLILHIFPGLTHIAEGEWIKAADCANRLSEQLDIRHAAFFWRLDLNAADAASHLRKLRQSKDLIQSVWAILEAMPDSDPLGWTNEGWAFFLYRHGQDPVFRALQIVGRMRPEQEDALLSLFHQAVSVQPIWSMSDLRVTGQDLMEHLQIHSGPVIGQLLEKLVQAVLLDPSANARARLLSRSDDEYRKLLINS